MELADELLSEAAAVVLRGVEEVDPSIEQRLIRSLEIVAAERRDGDLPRAAVESRRGSSAKALTSLAYRVSSA